MRRIIIILVAIGLLSCAVTGVQDSANIQQGHGVLVMKLSTNYNEGNNPLLAKMKLFFAKTDSSGVGISNQFLEIASPGGYQVFSLPSGEYDWNKITMGNLYTDMDEQSGFTLEPGIINYLGDLNAVYEGETWGLDPHYLELNLEFNEESVKAFLENQYPKLIEHNDFKSGDNVILRASDE